MHGVRNSTFGVCAIALAVACGPSGGPVPGETDAAAEAACTDAEARCRGAVYQVCRGGTFIDQDICADACAPDLGCVDCWPGGTMCQGDQVHRCNQDGTIGESIETCEAGACASGSCTSPRCAEEAELIYVVDNQYRLLSFDPRELEAGEDPFTLIGPLSCPTEADAYPGWSNPPTPFSMSVDRDATAWVLYTNGELFHVSTEDARCTPTEFVRGQQDFQLFGMGFVTDAPGSTEERLWIAGGPSSSGQLGVGDLGFIDKSTLEVTRVASLPDIGTNSPELTGTGDAALFGYYPGAATSTLIAGISKEDASHHATQTWTLPALGTEVMAWAFAHWGGSFYMFVTTREASSYNAQVLFFDPDEEQVTTELTWQPYRVVGAGVSTCAPIVVE